jgi:endonuclease/exonuclease/phosphatase family metal-dependent hydrolase
MTYNVRSMRDDRDALGRVMRSAEPDVVLIQESPRFLRWRSLCAELARRGNLVVVSGGRPAGSNLILSTLSIDVVSHAEVLFTRDPRLHRRGTAIATLSKEGRQFAVAGTHLDLVEQPRIRHVGELDQAIEKHVAADVPVVVGGDFNDVPGSPVWKALSSARQDAWTVAGQGDGLTSSPLEPRRRIDALFVDPRLKITNAWIIEGADVERATDHRPVVVELEL